MPGRLGVIPPRLDDRPVSCAWCMWTLQGSSSAVLSRSSVPEVRLRPRPRFRRHATARFSARSPVGSCTRRMLRAHSRTRSRGCILGRSHGFPSCRRETFRRGARLVPRQFAYPNRRARSRMQNSRPTAAEILAVPLERGARTQCRAPRSRWRGYSIRLRGPAAADQRSPSQMARSAG